MEANIDVINPDIKSFSDKDVSQSLNNVDAIKKTKTNKSKIKENDLSLNNKDDNFSDYSKADKSSLSSSNLYLSSSLNRMNSEVDLDKIIAGKDESQKNLINLNDNFKIEERDEKEEKEEKEEKKEKEEKEEKKEKEEKEEKEIVNENNILGGLFRKVVKKNKDKEEMRFLNIDLNKSSKDFSSILNARLNKIKERTISYLENTKKEFDKRYAEYFNKILKYINENELKMGKLLKKEMAQAGNENILEFADNTIFKQFDEILEIHENIFNSIEEHINLLRIFLDQVNLIKQKNPLECYINTNSNEILNCWFLNKIDFQKINLSNVIINKDLSEICSNYLCKKKDNNFAKICIKKDTNGNISLGPFLKENFNNIQKLKFVQVKSDEINNIFKAKDTKKKPYELGRITIINSNENYSSAEKLKSLSLIESDLSSNALYKIYAPSLIKLKLKRSSLSLNLKPFFESMLGQTQYLQTLVLQKCFLDDQSLLLIIDFLSEKSQILESLQEISFSGNNITRVELYNYKKKEWKCKFKALQNLDFSKNNIFHFPISKDIFPDLKVLDLTDNNFSNHMFFDNVKGKTKFIVLLNNNMFLTNNNENLTIYRNYLNEQLPKFKYKIKKLYLSFLYDDEESLNQLIDLRISPMVKISLIKLDLSYCALENRIVCKFLQNNFGLLNLKILNLNNNLITLEIFGMIRKIDISLENLNSLDLSMNEINSLKMEDLKQISSFILSHSKLKKIKFQETKFCQELLVLYLNQEIKDECEKINNELIEKGFKFVVETENKILISPIQQLFEIKDKEL